MSKSISYPRPKAAPTVSTAIVFTVKAAEHGNVADVFRDNAGSPVTGTTAGVDARIQADADESGGTDVQDVFKVEALPAMDSSGKMTVALTVTPIKGDGTAGTPQTLTVTHDEYADTWQTAAGRARQ